MTRCPSWSKGPDSSSGSVSCVGSNPTLVIFGLLCVLYAPLAQLDRASDFYSAGHEFESRRGYIKHTIIFVTLMVKYNASWYKSLKKAPLSPPNWVFGIVWPALYAMMGLSCYLIWTDTKCRPYCNELNPFWIQLALNLCWTTIFFKYKQMYWGFFIILAILIYTLETYKRFMTINPLASYLLIPYLVWITFAGYLNGYILIMN